MSIREIARELYRLQKEVQKIEEDLRKEKDPEKKLDLEKRLREVKAERDRVKAVLEGMKKYPDIRRPR